MEIYPLIQAKLLLLSFAFGGFLGLVRDGFRLIASFFGGGYAESLKSRLSNAELPILRKPLQSLVDNKICAILTKIIEIIGDSATIVSAGIGITILNYGYNNGEFRFFSILGTFLGFVFYFFTVGRMIKVIVVPLSFLIKYFFCSFFVTFGYPLLKIFGFFVKNIKKLFFLCSFTIANIFKKVYNIMVKDRKIKKRNRKQKQGE